MNHLAPEDGDIEFDLEGGSRVSEKDLGQDSVLDVKKKAKPLISEVSGGLVDGLNKTGSDISGNVFNSNGVSVENSEAVTQKNIEGVEKMDSAEKKRTSNKKHPKPPRPPRSPSLDAADPQLIREIAELVMLKRARIKRRKAIKKMKAAKTSSSSSSGNRLVLAFTIVFILVEHHQEVQLGPKEAGLIMLPNYPNPYASVPGRPDYESPNMMEQAAGSDPSEKPRRDVG